MIKSIKLSIAHFVTECFFTQSGHIIRTEPASILAGQKVNKTQAINIYWECTSWMLNCNQLSIMHAQAAA